MPDQTEAWLADGAPIDAETKRPLAAGAQGPTVLREGDAGHPSTPAAAGLKAAAAEWGRSKGEGRN